MSPKTPSPPSEPSRPSPDDPPARGAEPHPMVYLRKQVRRLQNAFALRLDISPADRKALVGAMISRQEEDALSYWLQIFLAIGISTFGLVLDSTGVVIGAMLISPLMTPIVGLGMGLTTGSPFLTLRSLVRVGASIALIIAFAALLTRLLPYREVTGEIAGRTAPTLIDLGIASFCALAAGFTTVRHSSDTVAAAAGTAIGIALVPPLCVAGFGVGIASPTVAFGAGLLFTSNLCAIVFFTVLLFFCIGYNQIEVSLLESHNVKVGGRVAKLAAALRRAFETRYGPLLRFVLPTALVGAVFFPLSRALTEVAWKVRVRTEVAQIVRDVTAQDYAMRSAFTVEHNQVSIRLVLVASPEHAAEVEEELRARVAAVASAVPDVEVHAVPDFESLQRVANAAATPVVAPQQSRPDLDEIREQIEDRLQRWPRGVGAILYWGVGFEGDTCVIEVAHVGEPGGEFLPLLADALGVAIDRTVVLRERAVTLSRWTAGDRDIVHWLPHLATALQAATVAGITACVTIGPQTRREPLPADPDPPARSPPEGPSGPQPNDPGPQLDAPTTQAEPTQTEPTPSDTPTGAPPIGGTRDNEASVLDAQPVSAAPRFVDLAIPGAAAAIALLDRPSGRVATTAGTVWAVRTVRGDCTPDGAH